MAVMDHYLPLPIGNLGVEMFFVLSGFFITTLLLGEWARTGTVSLTAFYKRRARYFPGFFSVLGDFDP
jgi:peptidoglycan/LPS O-acetylase OafA/YrhL